MEPLFFKAENDEDDMGCDCDQIASMEPLFFKAENKARDANAAGGIAPASMEPLFFKAENISPDGDDVFFYLLQWSRFFSKRKMVLALVAELAPG